MKDNRAHRSPGVTVNTAVKSQKQLARLDRALTAGTLADVAGVIAELSPGDVAHLLSSSPPRYRHVLLSLLDEDQEAEVLNELPDDLRTAFLSDMEPEALASIVGKLDDDDVADILHELPDEITSQVLGHHG